MKKYSKKIALILVLSLTLAIAIPVLAATDPAFQTEIDGKYEAPTIDVVLTNGTVDAIINPYALPVDLKAEDNTTSIGKIKNSQIVTAKPLVGYSLSEVDLNVGATVIGVPTGTFRLASEKPEADSTMKTGLVYLEAKTVNDLGYSTSPDTTTYIGSLKGEKILTELNNWAKKDYRESNKDQILVGTRQASQSSMCTLKAATVAADGTKTIATTNGYMLARLAGDIVKAPTDEWVAADGVTVTISWTFEPNTTTTP